MNHPIKFVVTSLLILSGVITSQCVFANKKHDLEDLIIANNTNSNFDFISISGKGVVVNGNPNIKQRSQFTFKVGGKEATGYISYTDSAHHQDIKFVYDYTQPGGYVTVSGGEQYYNYSGVCTLNGNEIFVTNK